MLLCVALLSRSGAAAPSVQLSAPRPLFSRMAKSGRATRNMTLYRVTPVKLRGVADRCILHPSTCPLRPRARVASRARLAGGYSPARATVRPCSTARGGCGCPDAGLRLRGRAAAAQEHRRRGGRRVLHALRGNPAYVRAACARRASGWGVGWIARRPCTVSRCSAPERPGARHDQAETLNARLRGMTVVRCGLLGAQLLPREPERLHLQHHLLGARRHCAQRVRHEAVPSPLALSCKTSAQRVRLQLPSQQNRDRFRFGAGPYV